MTSVMPDPSPGTDEPPRSHRTAETAADRWAMYWVPTDTTTRSAAEPVEQIPPVPRRSARQFIENTLLNILAVFGVICIGLTIWAFAGGYSLIMFKTGSMSPTIPQGSLSLVHKIPATEVKVGDVITVDRPGERPVTHRVIEVHPQTGREVLIAMQGDANPNPDPGMYRVTEVRKVIWSAPGLAKKVVYLTDPYVLGGIAVAMSLLVLWAFWPRQAKTRE
ncbi:signal peptidase I [Gordonia sp. CPCC 206044]|uniref:signal peptidase I n=1 Tax=Gordonia sp. CPCC 206044 TaxID=3140793 RepID=UPI003AF3C9BA